MADTAIERHASSPEPTIADGNTEHDTETAMAAAAVLPATAEVTTDTPALSKNQQRRQRREAQRLANKPDRRAKERAMRKEKKAEKRRLVEEEGADPVEIGLQKKRARTEPIVPFGATVVIDLSFDDKMSDKEIKSMSTQLGHVYSVNRNACRPVKVICTPLNGKLQERMQTQGRDQHLRWKGITFRSDSLQQLWQPTDAASGGATAEKRESSTLMDKSNVIYLTADSPNLIETLDEGKTYIIGGIVDHNRYKNLCFGIAADLGVAHAALPIGKYIQMASRKVLTVNQCFDIMSRWLECRDWEKAFTQAIPQRKLRPQADAGEASAEPVATSDHEDEHNEDDRDG